MGWTKHTYTWSSFTSPFCLSICYCLLVKNWKLGENARFLEINVTNLIWSHLHAIWKTLKWESSASTLHTFFCEYNSSFFAVRVLWSRRGLFCDYNIVKAMEPPTTTYTDFPWHYGRKHQTTSKNCPKNIHFFYQSSVQPNRHPIGLHVY